MTTGTALHPPIDPYDEGMLDVGDGNLVHWEVCGNPAGKAAVVVHGGPGSGCTPGMRQYFDPARYRVVLFDQRGCGRSTPHAADPATDLRHNTTEHLIADMERLRTHLGIDRWLLMGGSWGSTLILAYAQRHPERVSEIVINGVTTTQRREIDWLYRGVGRFFPEQWARFRDAVPEDGRDDLPAAYARLTSDPDPAVRAKATDDWCAWEDAVLSLEPHGSPTPYGDRPTRARLAMVRITTHYFSHAAWLPESTLLHHAPRLTGIPGALFHGRLDLSSPLDTAWTLTRSWPEAHLTILESTGHKGSPALRASVRQTLDAFARQRKGNGVPPRPRSGGPAPTEASTGRQGTDRQGGTRRNSAP